jgi:hypothetical protein
MSEKDPAPAADPATPSAAPAAAAPAAAPAAPAADTPAPATAPASPAPTLAAAAPAGDPPAKPDATPAAASDWRKAMAGDDAEAAKRLGRFADPAQVWKSYRALEQRISSGDLKKALPENASAEELASWRKENGIPENEAGYVNAVKLENGLIPGEADKPFLNDFAKYVHGKNWTPNQYNDALNWYFDTQEKQRLAQEKADTEFKQQAEDALRADWEGADFRRNLTAVNNLIATMPDGLGNDLLSARMPNGRLVGDNPTFIKAMANLALELNPAASLVPAGTTDPTKTIDAELEGIREKRRNDPRAYDGDKKMQARELELLEAKQKMSARAV